MGTCGEYLRGSLDLLVVLQLLLRLAEGFDGGFQPVMPSEIPTLLAEVVYKCIAKAPVDRYQDVSELEKALRVVDQSGCAA